MSKISFDIVTRVISITVAPTLIDGENVITLDIEKELYSQGKIDWVSDETLRKLKYPITSTGGDTLPGSKNLGATFFINSDWKIAPHEGSHRFVINGNFYSKDGTSPFNRTIGNYNIFLEQTVSSLVDSTVSQLSEIEYSLYGGGVSIDEINGTTDLVNLAGSIGNPVKLEKDANDIVTDVKLPKKVFIRGNLSLSDATVSWENFEFVGESPLKTQITIDTLAIVSNCEFYDASVTGILDGNSHIERSVISNLFFVDGYIYNCAIGPATITLGTSTISNMFECYSTVPGALTPIVDMNGTGILALRGYKGGILLKNYNGVGEHSIDLSSGQIKLDNTITSGTFIVRGTGKLIDVNGNQISTGTWNGGVTIVNETSLYIMSLIPDNVWAKTLTSPTLGTTGHILNMTRFLSRKVFVDTELVINGDGSSGSPFNNIGDTVDFAEANSLREIVALKEIILDRNLKNFIITGIGTPVIDCNGHDLSGTEFSHCTMRGTYIGIIIVQESILDNGFYLNGYFENCAINGTISCVDGSNVLLKGCTGLGQHNLSMNGIGSSIVRVSSHDGDLVIKDANNINDAIMVNMSHGKLTLDVTCTNGDIIVDGGMKLTDNSNGSTIDDTGMQENLNKNKLLSTETFP